jgi:hypothetical protein
MKYAIVRKVLSLGISLVFASFLQAAQESTPVNTFAKLPIKELTVFKDGHAFVAHEGKMATDDKGNVVMDYLPTPVIGTFWPYVAERGAKLTSVVAGQRRVVVDRTALNLPELLEANIGEEVVLTENGTNYEATILGVPSRSSEEWAATSAPNMPERLGEKGHLLLLKTATGTKVVPLDFTQQITFKKAPRPAVGCEEFRNMLTLKLDWAGSRSGKSANVGLFYLQKGVRWIPSYKVEIDGNGHAAVKVQATLLNELADLEDVSVNLVVGVPSFMFKETIDPLALQQSLAQLSQYFQTSSGAPNSSFANNFANSIMSQQQFARASDYQPSAISNPTGDLGPEIGEAGKSEDLFVFNLPHVTLKKGERMVLAIAEFTLPYEDIFTLDLPFSPPPGVRGNLSSDQQRELARLFNSPKVMHKIRLTNSSKYPLTTAPALIIRDGRALAQGLMTYTSTGACADLTLTTAVDFQMKKRELETKRTSDALRENGSIFSRVDMTGKIGLTSHRAQPTEVEVTRYVLGAADTTDPAAKVEKVNSFEDDEFAGGGEYPYWWGWYGWPYWWHHVNGVARLTWKIKLDPKQPAELNYNWHYFWQ